MKTVDSDFTGYLTKRRVKIDKTVKILSELGEIYSRDSTMQIKIIGDISSKLAADDIVLIPLNSFTAEYTVDTVSYSAGYTTVVITGSTFPTDITGLQLALLTDVTADLISNGIGEISKKVEGTTLNSFMADDVDVTLDNIQYTYWKSDSSGLFQIADLFWLKLTVGYNGDDTELLIFGGVIQPNNIYPDKNNHTVSFVAQGHLKTLEAYPGFKLSDANGELLQLDCIELKTLTAGDNTVESIKTLSYNFTSEDLPGVEITGISQTNIVGVKSLKFRYPNLLRYADGDWTEVAENSSAETLTDANGATITVNTTTYDIRDREIFINVVSDLNIKIDKKGSLALSFADGNAVDIISDFSAVLRDASGYTDETAENEKRDDLYTIFDGSGQYLYLFADVPFYAINVVGVSSDLVASLALHFSSGFNSWTEIASPTDGTNDLTQDGVISWSRSDVEGWRETTIQPGGSLKDVRNKFGIRLSLSSYTSGSADVDQIKKRFILFGDDGSALQVEIDTSRLLFQTVSEDVVLRQISASWYPCTWKRNITADKLLDYILDAAQFPDALRSLATLQFTLSAADLFVWGQAPRPFYDKRITSIYHDATNSRLWLGVENELWYHDGNEYHFVDSIYSATKAAQVSIKALAQDSSGNIHGIAWNDRFEFMESDPYLTTASFLVKTFRATTSGIDTKTDIGDSEDYIMPCDQLVRKGESSVDGGDYIVLIGNDFNYDPGGENVVIPFEQLIKNDATAVRIMAGILSTDEDGFANSDYYFRLKPGHYQYLLIDSSPVSWTHPKLRFGNPGFAVWDSANDIWLLYQMQRDNSAKTDTNVKIGTMNYSGTFTSKNDLSNSSKQPLHGLVNSGSLYWVMVEWDDSGTDISEFSLREMVVSTGSDALLWGTGTDTAEASQSITGNEGYQAILEIVYDATNDLIHGLMLDRNNFEYHYFIYDITADEMYSTQTGDNFTFDKHMQLKNFCIIGESVYCVACDVRYKENSAYLVKAGFDSGTITLTKIGVINDTDFDNEVLIASGSVLYGATKSGVIWQYGTVLKPNIVYADLGDDDLRQTLNDTVSLANMLVFCLENREIHVQARNTERGNISITEDNYLLDGQVKLGNWQHYYHGVKVSWEDPVTGTKGEEKDGEIGWGKRVLTVSNKLVQNRHLARILANQLYNYFGTQRETIEIPTTELFHLEPLDRIEYGGDLLDLNTSTDYLSDEITAKEVEEGRWQMLLHGIEKTT